MSISRTKLDIIWDTILQISLRKDCREESAAFAATIPCPSLTSSSLLIFFLLVGVLDSTVGGSVFTIEAAVSRILPIWTSSSVGVSWRGEVDCGGYSPAPAPDPPDCNRFESQERRCSDAVRRLPASESATLSPLRTPHHSWWLLWLWRRRRPGWRTASRAGSAPTSSRSLTWAAGN